MRLCKNTDCIAEKSDENEKCSICDGYYIDDGEVFNSGEQWCPDEGAAVCNAAERYGIY